VTCCEIIQKFRNKGEVVMKRLLRIFALLMAASMLVWMVGCGGDDDDDDNDNDAGPMPEVLSTTPAAGGTQGGNAAVTFTLNKALAEATVSGAAGTTAIQGTNVVFTPSPAIPAGPVTLTLTGSDAGGQEVTSTLSFTATEPDLVAPSLVGANCDPPDGASGVDPAAYPEKLIIAFDENLASATVTAKDPDFNSVDTVEGMNVVITFLQYTLPNETPVSISVTVTDAAGNATDATYGFETMEKPQ
jgi:hypothetical protein